MDSIREFSYLEAGNLDWDEPRPKANNKNNIPQPDNIPQSDNLIHQADSESQELWNTTCLLEDWAQIHPKIMYVSI